MRTVIMLIVAWNTPAPHVMTATFPNVQQCEYAVYVMHKYPTYPRYANWQNGFTYQCVPTLVPN